MKAKTNKHKVNFTIPLIFFILYADEADMRMNTKLVQI